MEYRSKATLMGLPLIHIAVGSPRGGRPARGVARGWIAIGDIAFGLLLSIGGLALGTGISFGGLLLLLAIPVLLALQQAKRREEQGPH